MTNLQKLLHTFMLFAIFHTHLLYPAPDGATTTDTGGIVTAESDAYHNVAHFISDLNNIASSCSAVVAQEISDETSDLNSGLDAEDGSVDHGIQECVDEFIENTAFDTLGTAEYGIFNTLSTDLSAAQEIVENSGL